MNIIPNITQHFEYNVLLWFIVESQKCAVSPMIINNKSNVDNNNRKWMKISIDRQWWKIINEKQDKNMIKHRIKQTIKWWNR